MNKTIFSAAVFGITLCISLQAGATNCRARALEAVEVSSQAEMSLVTTISEGDEYTVSVGQDGSTEAIYNVSFPAGCEAKAVISLIEGDAFVQPVANRFGNRCLFGEVYRAGKCCTQKAHGKVECRGHRIVHPWEGPGRPHSSDLNI